MLTIRASTSVTVVYPDCPAGYDCSVAPKFPYGNHGMVVTWAGEEIVSYRESGRKPALAEVFAGGGARIRADVVEDSSWNVADRPEAIECRIYHSTSPREYDPNFKDGWMKTESLLEFVRPTGTLDAYAGHLLAHLFDTTCGRGFDQHFENASKAAWGGMNEPYEWTFKGFTRDQWRHSSVLVKGIRQSVTPNVLRSGSFYFQAGANSTGLIVSLRYFPAKELAAKAKQFQAAYPITSHGVKLLEDRE